MSSTPAWIYDDNEPLPLGEASAQLLGAKSDGLRDLLSGGDNVPPFFTLTTAVCKSYHARGRQLPDGVEADVMRRVERLLATSTSTDTRLAVRSGAAVSMPGMLTTKLNVAPDRMSLLAAIREVLDSWYSDEAIAHRATANLDDDLGTAVIVQLMIDTDVAGVAFSRPPDDAAGETILIEMVAGLGESLVGGDVTPNHVVVDRTSLKILDDVPSTQPKILDDQKMERLAKHVLAIDANYSVPVDVEWGYRGEELFIFQRRPIEYEVDDETRVKQAEARRIHECVLRRRLLVRHNLGETLPSPTPLTWSIWGQFLHGSGGFGELYRTLGYQPESPSTDDGLVELLGGKIYTDPAAQASLFGDLPFRYDPVALERDPEIVNAAPTELDVDKLARLVSWRLPRFLWRTWNVRRRVKQLTATAANDFENIAVPSLQEFLDDERATGPTNDARALLDRIESQRRTIFDHFAPQMLLPGMLGGIALATLTRQLEGIWGIDVGQRFACELVAGITTDESLDFAVRRAADSTEEIDDVLRDYGHRCLDEMELSAPRWREQPDTLLELARSSVAAPCDTATYSDDEASSKLKSAMVEAGASYRVEETNGLLRDARRLLPYRERGKHHFMKGFALLRSTIMAWSEAVGLGDDVFYLEVEELSSVADGEDPSKRIDDRRVLASTYHDFQLPVVLTRESLLTGERSATMRDVFAAKSVSSGRATGRVRCLDDDVDDGASPQILVCPTLSPQLIVYLPNTSAIIAEQGGLLSHMAIVARGRGIPVVVLADATRLLSSGQRVIVDADLGEVRRVAEDDVS